MKKSSLSTKGSMIEELRKKLDEENKALTNIRVNNQESKQKCAIEVLEKEKSIEKKLEKIKVHNCSSKGILDKVVNKIHENSKSINGLKLKHQHLKNYNLETKDLIEKRKILELIGGKAIETVDDYLSITAKLKLNLQNIFAKNQGIEIKKNETSNEISNKKQKFIENLEVKILPNYKLTGQIKINNPEGFEILKSKINNNETKEIQFKNGKQQEFEISKDGKLKIMVGLNNQITRIHKIQYQAKYLNQSKFFCITEFNKGKIGEKIKIKDFNNNEYQGTINLPEIINPNIEIKRIENIIWINNKENLLINGKVKIHENNGNKHEGKIEYGKMEGKGKYSDKNGYEYIGEYKNNLKEGKGIEKYADGDSYEGEFKNDKREGKGKYWTKDGYEYIGDLKNNLKEGKGIVKYAEGDSYEGEFKNDKREGKGKYWTKDGYEYIGDWKNNLQEGKGIVKYAEGDSYEGEFKNGNREGKGKYFWKDGRIHIGENKNNMIEGLDGKSMEGLRNGIFKVWNNDIPQSEKTFKDDVEQGCTIF